MLGTLSCIVLAQYATMREPMSRMRANQSVPSAITRKLGRLARFILFLCTAGWAFPHVCTEDMDVPRIRNGHTGGTS
jgi:hypothetical protein